MDFCLHVVEFTVGLSFHYAICFSSAGERLAWVRHKNSEPVEWIALYTTREELKGTYELVLFGEKR
jgi:hypothetical protein